MKEYARRKSSRLKNYNYSQNGAYFLTICTKDRKMLLGPYKRRYSCSRFCV